MHLGRSRKFLKFKGKFHLELFHRSVQQRTTVQFVDVPVPQVVLQERFSERIVGTNRRCSRSLCGAECRCPCTCTRNSSSTAVPLDTAE